LIYGTGGLAWGAIAHDESVLSTDKSFAQFPDFVGQDTRLGWSAGAGVDWKITPNLVLGALYLHYDLGNASSVLTGFLTRPNPPTTGVFMLPLPDSHLTVDAVTARLSWLFR
jgi:opacity protein-like surface antigen